MRVWFESASGEVLDFSAHPFRITEVTGVDRAAVAVEGSRAPAQDGFSVVGSCFEARTVGVSGVLTPYPADAESVDAVRRRMVRALCPKSGCGRFVVESGQKGFVIQAMAVDSPFFPQVDVRRPHQRFVLRFVCPNPYWLDLAETEVVILYFGVQTEFSEAGIAFGAGGIEIARYEWTEGRRIEVLNPGDVVAPMVIVFSGPVLNPTVHNRTTGEFIQILKDVRACEVVRIDSGFGRKTVRIESGGCSMSGMQFLNLDSSFLSLVPGMNAIEFVDEAPGEGSVARIVFRARYAGV